MTNLETKFIDVAYMTYLNDHKLTSAQYPMTQYVIEQIQKERTDWMILKDLVGLSPEKEMHQFNDRYMRGKYK